jgi:hypothetical protein
MGEPLEELESRVKEDRFKSEGERQIARLLERCGIDYRYEYPLAVVERGKLRILYPDFTLPGFGVIIEYAGMEKNKDYETCLERKKTLYQEMKVPALFIFPDFFKGYWPIRFLEKVEEIEKSQLEKLIRRIRELRRERRRPWDRQDAQG